MVLRDLGEYESAIDEYNKLLATAPDDAEAYRPRAQTLGDPNRCEESVGDLERALKLAPESAWTLDNLAWLYPACGGAESRTPDIALPLAEKAVELAPDSPDYLDTLARALAGSGRLEEALEAQARALEAAELQGNSGLKETLTEYYEELKRQVCRK
jgi:tetratricopeptide (TPR) repeat protein